VDGAESLLVSSLAWPTVVLVVSVLLLTQRKPIDQFILTITNLRYPDGESCGSFRVVPVEQVPSRVMSHLAGTAAGAVAAFAGTNLDDFVVLLVLFLHVRQQQGRWWQVVTGQFIGFAALVAASVVGALGLTFLTDGWVGLLGLLPLALGVRGLLQARRGAEDDERPRVAGMLPVALVTVANGGDNISVYALLFRTSGVTDTVVAIGVFFVLLGLWCVAAGVLSSRKAVVTPLLRLGHWLVPAVFVAIGVVILVRSGVLPRLAQLVT
jgi:cadmium resistance protein CadD (predicted permease)